MQKLCRITVPGLSVKRDFTAARRRLMAEFPDIHEVIAMTSPATLLALGRPALRNRHSRCIDHEPAWKPRVTPGPHNYYAVSYYNV
jgi:hypothetical protein